MPRRAASQPTEAQLEILNILWHSGPSTVRRVHECLQADRKTGLTTTLKMLQVMAEKGLVVRDDDVRPQLYAPAKPKEETQAGLLSDLADRAFNGSVRRLLVRAVEEGDLTRAELDEIRALIDSVRKGKPERQP